MSEGLALYLVLLSLYLVEGIHWIPAYGLVLFRTASSKWTLRGPNDLVGNGRGGVHLANPFLPVQEAFLTFWPRVSLSPEGVSPATVLPFSGGTGAPPPDLALPFESIHRLDLSDTDVVLNGSVTVRCGHAHLARETARWIGRCRDAAAADREAVLRDELERRFDMRRARARLDEVTAGVDCLRWACWTMFFLMFVGFPALTFLLGLHRAVLPAGGLLWTGALGVGWIYFREHRRLYPEAVQERWMTVVKVGLCPPIAPRLAEHLSWLGMRDFHPILVCGLLPMRDRERLLARILRDIGNPVLDAHLTAPSRGIATWYGALEKEFALAFLRKEGAVETAVAASPVVREAGAVGYCPRCHCQYSTFRETCHDCSGVKIALFEAERGVK